MGKVKKRLEVFFDFDNTITPFDVFDDMSLRFGDERKWQILEQKWKKGLISSRECLSGQLRGMRVNKKLLADYLSGVKIDSHFKKLVALLRKKRIKTVILSDNFDFILKGILEANAVPRSKIYSNRLRFSNGCLLPQFPFMNKKCRRCAHCKTKNLLANKSRNSIICYIGDGLSDMCPAEKSDIVFAKGELLAYLKRRHISCVSYRTLRDVYEYFKENLL